MARSNRPAPPLAPSRGATPSAQDAPAATLGAVRPSVTLGLGVKRPRGRRVALAVTDPIAALARVLADHVGVEAWWSAGVFDSNHRGIATWREASVIPCDVDFHDADGKHAPLPPNVRDRIALTTLPASLAHLTPRGIRAIAMVDQTIRSPDEYKRAAYAFAGRIASALAADGLVAERNGLVVDLGSTVNLARLLFTPRATARGVRRDANVIVVGGVVARAELLSSPPPFHPPRSGHFPWVPPLRKCPRGGDGVTLRAASWLEPSPLQACSAHESIGTIPTASASSVRTKRSTRRVASGSIQARSCSTAGAVSSTARMIIAEGSGRMTSCAHCPRMQGRRRPTPGPARCVLASYARA